MQVASIPQDEMSTVPASMDSVVVRLLSFSALVSSNCPRTLRDLARIYPVSRRGYDGELPVSARMQMPARDDREMWSVDALGRLEYLIDTAAIADLARYVIVHAGVVANGASAIMFPGATGTGKSTLVAALCLNGFSYWSDELAIFDRTSLAIHPFRKSICLKDGGWRALADLYGPQPEPVVAQRLNGSRVHFLTPPSAEIPAADARVKYIVVPIRQAGRAATLTQISSAQAFTELLKHSLNLPQHGTTGVEALAQLVEDAQCYSLTYDDLQEAVAAISKLVGR